MKRNLFLLMFSLAAVLVPGGFLLAASDCTIISKCHNGVMLVEENGVIIPRQCQDVATYYSNCVDATPKEAIKATTTSPIATSTADREIISNSIPAAAENIILTSPTDYVVQPGDNLWKISRAIYHSGKYWGKIFYENNLTKSLSGYPVIVAGQKLSVPALTGNEVMSSTYVYQSLPANASSSPADSAFSSEQATSSFGTASGDLAATRGDRILYRIIKDCATGKPTGQDYQTLTEFSPNEWILGHLQIVDLDKTGYSNYSCSNRYQEQCIADGSFDSYYEEWCSRGVTTTPPISVSDNSNTVAPAPQSSAQPPELSAAESLSGQVAALIPNGAELLTKITTSSIEDTKGLILFRIIRNCATGAGIINDNYPVLTTFGPGRWEIHTLQEVFLDSADYYNYTCQSRFQEQCIGDGSFDSYYDELCVRQ